MGIPNTSKRALIQKRRKTVAANLLAGHRAVDIASAMGISPATITSDIKAIFAEWRTDRDICLDGVVEVEISRLERMTAANWEGVLEGKPQAIDRQIRIMERKAKLLGLDKPVESKVELARKITDEELERLLSGR